MIDIKLIREEPETFKTAAKNKHFDVDIDRLLQIDDELRTTKTQLQDLRTEQNAAGKKIAKMKGDQKQAAIKRMGELKQEVQDLSDKMAQLEPEFADLMLRVPQVPDPDVPVGEDDTDNVEIRTEGTIPNFDFEMRDHVELGEMLDIIDIPRGVKLAGSRNYFLKGAGALLHQAILRLAVDQMVKKGYELLTVPVIVNEEVMEGTGYFPVGRDQAYLCERDNQALVGTAEVSVTALHSEEIMSEADLPKKYVAMSTCFRREAGAAGKDTRGLYRVHFFDKVEQVIVCENDVEQSKQFHKEILANAEDVLQALQLPYRVVNVCTGDLGMGQVQKYDIETWMPSREAYGETHSASRFYEFQARRLNLRYRDEDGKVQFCHTLNNTVIASPRVLIPVMEMYQNADGSITVPDALKPYMCGIEKIEPTS
ncbi:MAG: serine--tRNA ligase [Phycisphaerae bacterium]